MTAPDHIDSAQPAPAGETSGRVEIDYTNYQGKRSVRTILPTGRLIAGFDAWHPDAPWLIEARDVERNVMRTFDPAKIHRWGSSTASTVGADRVVVPDELRKLAHAPGLASVDTFRFAAARWVRELIAAAPPQAAPAKAPDEAPGLGKAEDIADHWHQRFLVLASDAAPIRQNILQYRAEGAKQVLDDIKAERARLATPVPRQDDATSTGQDPRCGGSSHVTVEAQRAAWAAYDAALALDANDRIGALNDALEAAGAMSRQDDATPAHPARAEDMRACAAEWAEQANKLQAKLAALTAAGRAVEQDAQEHGACTYGSMQMQDLRDALTSDPTVPRPEQCSFVQHLAPDGRWQCQSLETGRVVETKRDGPFSGIPIYRKDGSTSAPRPEHKDLSGLRSEVKS